MESLIRETLLPALLDAAARGAIILAGAALLARLLHRRSAAARHAVWTVALLAQLAVPVLGWVLPKWRVPVDGAPAWMLAGASAEVTTRSVPGMAAGGGGEAAGVQVSAAVGAGAGAPPQQQDALGVPTNPNQSNAAAIDRTRSSDPPAQTASSTARDGVVLLALIWLVGLGAIVARFGAGTIVVSRLARTGGRVHDGRWLSLTQRLADRLGIRRPLTLLRGDRLGVPVTWGIVYPVVLLPEEADEWTEERRSYVLVHEMAHVKRLDALTQLIAQLATAIFWFDPLVWYASRRMRAEREHACDDYVLRHGTTPSLYASDLLEMVRRLGGTDSRGGQPAFAALAMARRSEFEGRMLSILDPNLDRHPLRRTGVLALVALTFLLAIPLAAFTPAPRPIASAVAAERTAAATESLHQPTIPAAATPVVVSFDSRVLPPSPAAAQAEDSSRNAQSRHGKLPPESSCRVSRNGVARSVESHIDEAPDWEKTVVILATEARCTRAGIIGPVTLAPDDRDVGIAPRGTLHLADRRTRRQLRELIVRMDAAGKETRIYRVDGVVRPEAEGREWMAEVIPHLVRESGIEAGARVARIRRAGGTDAVLAEIAQLRSTRVQRAYYEALLATPGLKTADAERALRQATRTLTDDDDLSAVINAATRPAARRGAGFDAATIGRAVQQITSDSDLRAVLVRFLTDGDRAFRLMSLREARRITSDGDLAALLIAAAPHVLASDESQLHREYFTTAAGISSDDAAASVLLATMRYTRARPAVVDGILDASTRVASDADRANVLVALAQQRVLETREQRRRFLESAKGISSDSDYRRVIEMLP